MKRKGQHKKINKDNEMIAFIEVLIDLFPYDQYRD